MGSGSKATPFIVGAVLAVGVFLFFGWDLAHHYVPYSPQPPHFSVMRFLPLTIWLAALALRGVVRWVRQRQSRSWPYAAVTIESGSIDMVQTRQNGWVYPLKASYSYFVKGERYGGNYTETFASLSEAEGVLKSLREIPP